MAVKAPALEQLCGYLAHGPHEIEVVHEYLLGDASRGKEIPLRIYAPADDGPFPLILYSHGAGDSNATSPLLLRHWASHGYVVIAPTHLFGARPLVERSLGRLREELLRMHEMGPEAWRERTADLKTVLDTVDTLTADVPALAGRVDQQCVAVAGHSNGGYTAMLFGGAVLTDPVSREVFDFSDPRPCATMIISGPGCDGVGLDKHSWRNCTKPMMVMAGSRDPGYVSGGPMWRAEPYLYSPPGDKYLLYLRGAHHLSYVGPIFDLPLRDPARRGQFARGVRAVARVIAKVAPLIDQAGLFDYSRIASTAFWDAYVKGDSAARDFLHSHALDRYSGGNARIKAR